VRRTPKTAFGAWSTFVLVVEVRGLNPGFLRARFEREFAHGPAML
jgi:hypothetical protein